MRLGLILRGPCAARPDAQVLEALEPGGELHQPLGISLDSNGALWVAVQSTPPAVLKYAVSPTLSQTAAPTPWVVARIICTL